MKPKLYTSYVRWEQPNHQPRISDIRTVRAAAKISPAMKVSEGQFQAWLSVHGHTCRTFNLLSATEQDKLLSLYFSEWRIPHPKKVNVFEAISRQWDAGKWEAPTWIIAGIVGVIIILEACHRMGWIK